MPFTEAIKKEARLKAHYRHCICEQIAPLEVHHIVPQEERDDDSFDNAVALCANCHNTYGDSHQHRKWIKEKRDWWYGHCERQYAEKQKLEEIYQIVVDTKADNKARPEQFKNLLQGAVGQIINSLSRGQEPDVITNVAGAASTTIAISDAAKHLKVGDRMAITDAIEYKLTKTCPKCGKKFSVVPDPNVIPTCPKCGMPVTT
jgi:hypothetical protein